MQRRAILPFVVIAGAAAAAVVLLAPGGRVSAVNGERPAAAIDPAASHAGS